MGRLSHGPFMMRCAGRRTRGTGRDQYGRVKIVRWNLCDRPVSRTAHLDGGKRQQLRLGHALTGQHQLMRCHKTRGVLLSHDNCRREAALHPAIWTFPHFRVSQYSNIFHRRATTGRGALALVQDHRAPECPTLCRECGQAGTIEPSLPLVSSPHPALTVFRSGRLIDP